MAVQISGNDITVPRDGTFTRNVTIGGTLTYEDVTNIDSVGLVTARTGIEIGARPGVAASISVDGNMIVSGVPTRGGEVQIPDYIHHVGDNNCKFGFESGDTCAVETAGSERVRVTSDGNLGIGTITPSGLLHTHAASGTNRNYIEASASNAFLRIKSGSTSNNSGVEFFSGSSNIANVTGLGAGGLQFEVAGSTRVTMSSGGNIDIADGNLVIGTAGHGIDFSAQTATSASGASASSELLDHYEEGTWTPTYESVGGTYGYTTQNGYYTRVGNQVSVSAYIQTSSVSATSHNLIKVTGLPFAEGKSQRTPGSVRCNGFQGTLDNMNYPSTWSVEAGQTFGELQKFVDGGNSDYTTSTMNNASYVYLQCTYQVA